MYELINREVVIKLINSPEDDRHDFKQEWYKEGQKSEMVRDIFSFVNTVHNESCYLILGVTDQQTIIGVEEDFNRMNQQNMIDFISHLPIANDAIPKIYVQSIELEGHEIDIIVIPNTNDVPVYLSSKYPRKGQGKPLTPGQIFSRIGDVNTPVNETTNFYQVQYLWRKQFHLNVPIQEQYKYVLKDITNWSYIEQEENMGFVYNLNPDFFISMEDDDQNRNEVEALSIDQIKVRMGWNYLKLKYRNLTIISILIVSLDEARHHTVVPNYRFIKNSSGNQRPLSYYGMLEDTFEYLVDYMINTAPNSFTSYDNYSSEHAKKNIVIYQSEKEETIVQNKIIKDYPELSKLIEPTSEEIELFSRKVRSEINIKTEYDKENIQYILRQRNLAQLINNDIINQK
ncbi:AlbA family DNA-binding domain-containing protein [Carnobacterium pleistocenium]|uniref:AlbA family DNA-binding domain-containing protein n=1 Tax=Carnobacterium pleistocenium TaxID=181073 RepID=UPI0006895204|nr:ATP-binding protein [Carnobacterium pleistocenium]